MPPRRPLVFAVGDADGNLHIYDLKRSRGCPEATLKVTRNRSPVYAIVFNPRSPQLLATADGEGFVKVWRLSGALSTMAPREQVCCAHDSLHSAVRLITAWVLPVQELLDRLATPRGAEQAPADGDADANEGYDFDGEEG